MGEHSNQSSKLTYRTDIDGLRAIAVLLVIGDHFRTHFSGGYVGVDVFFVISGYLISAAILKEMANGTFSIVNFYERRIRRIFPALIVMLVVVCGLAYRYLFPTELADFARSLLAAMFSVSNFFSGIRPATSTPRAPINRCCTPGRWRLRNSSTSSFRSFWC